LIHWIIAPLKGICFIFSSRLGHDIALRIKAISQNIAPIV
jgi:hypothetical protein